MPAPPKEGPTFTPRDNETITRAYEDAVRVASKEGSPFAAIPAPELRRRLASLIVAEAAGGHVEADYLTRTALRGLRVMFGAGDGIDVLGH